ncbi:MAG: hypothetical protein FD129_1796 [bacterium]|nr:MAG: hypothetical protein FD129_1796 [bacterium]
MQGQFAFFRAVFQNAREPKQHRQVVRQFTLGRETDHGEPGIQGGHQGAPLEVFLAEQVDAHVGHALSRQVEGGGVTFLAPRR